MCNICNDSRIADSIPYVKYKLSKSEILIAVAMIKTTIYVSSLETAKSPDLAVSLRGCVVKGFDHLPERYELFIPHISF